MPNDSKPTDTPVVNQSNNELDGDFDVLLSSIEPGWKVSIWRSQPGWCSGYLETITVDPSQPLDLDYLAANWGGETLTIKVRDKQGKFRQHSDIDLRSYPPKFQGVPINRNNVDIAFHQGNIPGPRGHKAHRDQELERHLQIVNQQPNHAQDITGILKEAIGVVAKLRANDQEMYRPLLEGNPNLAPTNPMDQFMQQLAAYEKMRDVFGHGEQQLAQEPDTALFSVIGDIAKAFMNRPQPPQGAQPPPPHQQLPPPRPAPIRNDVQQQNTAGLPPSDQLTNILAKMPPEKSADFFINVVSRMKPEQAETMFNEIQTRLGMDSDLDSDEEYIDEEDEGIEGETTDTADPIR